MSVQTKRRRLVAGPFVLAGLVLMVWSGLFTLTPRWGAGIVMGLVLTAAGYALWPVKPREDVTDEWDPLFREDFDPPSPLRTLEEARVRRRMRGYP